MIVRHGTSSAFPHMFLRIQLGCIGWKVNDLQVPILFDPISNGTSTVPSGIVPIEDSSLCWVDSPDLVQNIDGDIPVLKVGFECVFITGLQIKKSVDVLSLSSSGLYGDRREFSLRQTDLLESGGRGENHLVGTEDNGFFSLPKSPQYGLFFCFPFLDRFLNWVSRRFVSVGDT